MHSNHDLYCCCSMYLHINITTLFNIRFQFAICVIRGNTHSSIFSESKSQQSIFICTSNQLIKLIKSFITTYVMFDFPLIIIDFERRTKKNQQRQSARRHMHNFNCQYIWLDMNKNIAQARFIYWNIEIVWGILIEPELRNQLKHESLGVFFFFLKYLMMISAARTRNNVYWIFQK